MRGRFLGLRGDKSPGPACFRIRNSSGQNLELGRGLK